MASKPATKIIAASDFVHLHNHTHYSLLDGLQKVPEMLDRVKSLGMDAVAITDHGTLSGAIEFYKEAKARHIKPIIGIETYIAPHKHTDKEGKQDANPYHLVLLAMNNQGYENLMRLSSIAHLEGFYYKPRIDRELLEQYQEGIIVLSGCIGGEVGDALRNNQAKQAEEVAVWYKKVFGDRYYIELQDHSHEWDEQKKVNEQLVNLATKLEIEMVVTSDAHYAHREDQDAHEVLLCVQTGSQLDDPKRMSLKDTHLFVTSPQEIEERWRVVPQAISNTKLIAERCTIELELGGILIPTFKTPAGQSEKNYLELLAFQGMAWRYGGLSQKQAQQLDKSAIIKLLDQVKIDRLKYELEVINNMGFAGYFLIVADFINWGKEQGIIFGPGRGSAAGSIVAYALNITDLDPIGYDLMFERFLNPDRISMPDIDIDIQDTRRDEVIQYVVEKYGKTRVANIVTFGKMAARNAIRDTARVLGVNYADADRLAKLVPPPIQGRHIPLARSIVENQELKQEYTANPQSKQVIDLAVRLEGTIRSHGVHAAGVVIAPDEIVKFTPLEMAQKGVVSTQYSMGPVEELGLLKMDFLGLSNLTVIKNALRIIKKVYKTDIDISQIPLDDAKTYQLFSNATTTGVFQVESAGMQRYLKELKPDRLEDIIAMVALYRPGPIAEIPRYIEGKNKPETISYLHPSLEPILNSTYGVMVYQEQIIMLLQLIAGYSAGQADLVRKAIGKKKRDIMAAEEPKFIKGCLRQGLSKDQANKLWNLIQPFADYSFNKAHASCYALIAYQTAYLKANYPAAFMAALLTSDFENTERLTIELTECKHMGIPVLPPDVNESFVEFAVRPEDNTIRFGLAAIKNVGVGAVEKILEARVAGQFLSVEDFAKRVSTREVNRKTWESLIKAGAFDTLADRHQLLFNLDKILAFASKQQKDANSGQTDLFGGEVVDISMQPVLHLETPPEVLLKSEKLQWERELLGLYLSSHPLDDFDTYLQLKAVPLSSITTALDGKAVKAGGIITTVRKITTKNGSNMAFVKIEDKSGEVELIIFPKAYEEYSEIWEVDQIVLVDGKVNTKDRDGKSSAEVKIFVDKAAIIDPETAKDFKPRKKAKSPAKIQSLAPTSAVRQSAVQVVITVPERCEPATLLQIKDLLHQHAGPSEVVVRLDDTGNRAIKLPFKVRSDPDVLKILQAVEGVNSVALA